MRVLITGAGGMLGHDLMLAAKAAAIEADGLTRTELDVTNPDAIDAAITDCKPDVVINCAAFTNVDGAEEQRDAAFAVNASGAENVARAATAAGITLIQLSTDYVFDGTSTQPYAESDTTCPINVYGESKLAGELAVAAQADRHLIVRTSWLFGVGGRNFVETMLSLAAERDEISVVDDQLGCPTWTGHLAYALIGLAQKASRQTGSERRALGGVHHLSGDESCSWFGFAKEIFARTNEPCLVTPITTAEAGRPAPRPAQSILISTRPDTPRLPAWHEGLTGYLAARSATRVSTV